MSHWLRTFLEKPLVRMSFFEESLDLYWLLFSRNYKMSSSGTFLKVSGMKKLINKQMPISAAKSIITRNPASMHRSSISVANTTTPSPTREMMLVPITLACVG